MPSVSQLLLPTSLYGYDSPQFVFVRPKFVEMLHIPESPVPLNSPEQFHKNPFKFNRPAPPGSVVRDIILDQDRFHLWLIKLLKRQQAAKDSKKLENLQRNKSNLFKILGNCKTLKIATQSFLYNEMGQCNSPLASDSQQSVLFGSFGAQSFHPTSPNFVSQHSILDLTHVSRSLLSLCAFPLLCKYGQPVDIC